MPLPFTPSIPFLLHPQAQALLHQAEAAHASRNNKAPGHHHHEEEGEEEGESKALKPGGGVGGGGGGVTAAGKPGWLSLSPAWTSAEARAMEAACAVMKQGLDMQAVQVCVVVWGG